MGGSAGYLSLRRRVNLPTNQPCLRCQRHLPEWTTVGQLRQWASHRLKQQFPMREVALRIFNRSQPSWPTDSNSGFSRQGGSGIINDNSCTQYWLNQDAALFCSRSDCRRSRGDRDGATRRSWGAQLSASSAGPSSPKRIPTRKRTIDETYV